MVRRLFVSLLTLLSAVTLGAQELEFKGAQWIAMEADSTILFPHIHLLKKSSEKGQSLKQYALPVFEKQVQLKPGTVRKAWASVCGMGQYELFINGQRIGQNFLDPGWTMYDKELLYNTFDLTSHLSSLASHFTVRVMLGGGMYDIPVQGYHKFAGSCGAPKLLFALHVEYADGQRQTVVSDGSWKVSESPVRYSSIFGGEAYDATFSSEAKPVVVTRPHWDVPLKKQNDRTRLRIKAELPMTPITSKIYDSRQNCSGIVRLMVCGKRGSTVTLRPAELLKDGHAYQRCAPNYAWTYTLRGDAGGEIWQPQFTYTGFRYVEVEADDDVEILKLTALHTSADVEMTGQFECSDELLNRIF